MKQVSEVAFEELLIPRKEVQHLSETRYRVYKDSVHWELVEASSALEALQRCGIQKAYKIERHNPLGNNVLQMGTVQELLGVVHDAPKEEQIAKEVVEIEATPSALSGEEVEKLLGQSPNA